MHRLSALVFAALPFLLSAQSVLLDRALLPIGAASGQGLAVTTDAWGNVYSAGCFAGTVDLDPGLGSSTAEADGPVDAYVTKCNAAGELIWARRITGPGSEIPVALALDAAGNVFITGRYDGAAIMDPDAGTALPYNGGTDVFIAKLGTDGALAWAQGIGGPGNDAPTALVLGADGLLYVGGAFAAGTVDFAAGPEQVLLTTAGPNGNEDGFVLKMDGDGAVQWARRIGDKGDDRITGLALDGQGNIVLTGTFASADADFDPAPDTWATLTPLGATDAFVARWDADGMFQWARRMGGADADAGVAVAVDADGYIYTTGDLQGTGDLDPDGAGEVFNSAGGADVFITKHTAAGTLVWARVVGGATADHARALVLDPGGRPCIGGCCTGTVDMDPGAEVDPYTAAGQEDLFLLGLDADGGYAWDACLGSTGDDDLCGLHCDAAGAYWATGFFSAQMDPDPEGGSLLLTAANGASSPYVLGVHTCSPVIGPVMLDSGCEAYVWNDEVYVEPGTYVQHFTTTRGCDSTATLQLTLANIDTTVVESGPTLAAQGYGTRYQWIDCDNGDAPVEGATEATFTPASNGHYAVIVTLNGCSATSGCHAVISTGLPLQGPTLHVGLAPDPAHDHVLVTGAYPLGEVRLLDMRGAAVRTLSTVQPSLLFSLEGLRPGLYLVEVRGKAGCAIQRLVVE